MAINYKKSVGWMVLWSFCFSTVMTLAKKIDPTIPGATLIFCRLALGLSFAMPLFMRQGLSNVLKTDYPRIQWIRAVVVTAAMGFTYYAYRNLPLAEAAAIGLTGPLFTSLLAVIFLGEKMTWVKWLAMIGGYCGVLFIVKPAQAEFNIAFLAALAANLLAGLAIIMAKYISKTDSSQTILFYGTAGTLILTSMQVLFSWQTPSIVDFIYLVFIGAAGMLSQYCYLQALKYAPTSFVTPFEYLRLCVTIPMGFIIFNEVPDQYSLLGSLFIIVSIMFLVRTHSFSNKNNAS